jgi:pilus assembly protein CpaF
MGFYAPLEKDDYDAFHEEPEAAPADQPATGRPDAAPATGASLADRGLSQVEKFDQPLDDAGRQALEALVHRIRAWELAEKSARNVSNLSNAEVRAEITRIAPTFAEPVGVPAEVMVARALELYEGLGGIELWLRRDDVSDIMINAVDKVFVEAAGKLVQVTSPFRSAQDIDLLINSLAQRCGLGKPNWEDPVLDGRFDYELPEDYASESGERRINVRVNVVVPPLAGSGSPAISLRRPSGSGFHDLGTWVERGSLTDKAANFLRAIMSARANVVIVGATGSGKTSLLKALIAHASADDRIVTVEEASELILHHANWVPLIASRVGNDNYFGISELIRQAMRMRPERIIVGECRAPTEVTGFVQAVNTGHDGSITTVHASSAEDGLNRLMTLASQAGDKAPLETVGRLIAQAVDVVVFVGARKLRAADGSESGRLRRVMEIVTIQEYDPAGGGRFVVKPVFDRYPTQTGIHSWADITRPLLCRGWEGVSEIFRARMQAQGLDDDALRALLEPDSEPLG